MNDVALLGNPNVGKSVLFGRLTGSYTTVSNYPGTTVEVSRGTLPLGGAKHRLIDTPGLYSIYPITEEERVALRILTEGGLGVAVQVVDAKNLERMLPLTFQLMESGAPLILALNMIDEAERIGIEVDAEKLSHLLGVPVVATVAIDGRGIDRLRGSIGSALAGSAAGGKSTIAPPPFSRARMQAWHERARDIARQVVRRSQGRQGLCRLDRALLSPITGLPILAAVVYAGLYLFVGVLGAGVVVDLLEGAYADFVNPLIERAAAFAVPWPLVRGLFAGEYGILTLGLRYAVAIIMPIVAFYFFVFALLEDSGYLPRLGFLLDRAFKRIGLSGRAIIPMVLGLGCVSMATMVTRTLPTRRERLIATLLLALCIPCAAQTGVIMGLLAVRPHVLAAWACIIVAIFMAVGALGARILPGARPAFLLEIPPMRVPQMKNVLLKTGVRVAWYFKEVVPLFALASAIIWLGQVTGAFDWTVRLMGAPLAAMGLPPQSATAFLFGFFRRDYGAAGLYDLNQRGLFTGNQLLIAAVVLTLFLPCITQFIITIKERGWKIGCALSLFILLFSFCVGVLLHGALIVARVHL